MLTCGVGLKMPPLLDKQLLPIETLLTQQAISGDQDPVRSRIPRVFGRSFVHYLVQRFGKTAFLALYAALPAGSDLDEIRGEFASRLAVTLESVIADWEARIERQDEACVYLLECEEPSISGRVDFVTECGLAPDASSGIRFFPFDIGSSQRVRLDLHGDAPIFEVDAMRWSQGTFVKVASCDTGDFGLVARNAPYTQLLGAPQGRYFVEVSAAPGTASAIEVTDLGPPPQTCTAEAPIPLAIGHDVVVSRRGVTAACEGQAWCPGDAVSLLAEQSGKLFPTFEWDEDFGLKPAASLFRCNGCPAELAAHCVQDPFVAGTTPGAALDAIGSSVEAGQVLQLASGPSDDPTTAYVRYTLASP